VKELIVADPHDRLVRCFDRHGDHYLKASASTLVVVSADELTLDIHWPPKYRRPSPQPESLLFLGIGTGQLGELRSLGGVLRGPRA